MRRCCTDQPAADLLRDARLSRMDRAHYCPVMTRPVIRSAARSGRMAAAGRGRPWFGTTSNGDLGNGFLAAIGIVRALYDRTRTGKARGSTRRSSTLRRSTPARLHDTRGPRFRPAQADADQTGFNAFIASTVAPTRGCAWPLGGMAALVGLLPDLTADPQAGHSRGRASRQRRSTRSLAGRPLLRRHTAANWFARPTAPECRAKFPPRPSRRRSTMPS